MLGVNFLYKAKVAWEQLPTSIREELQEGLQAVVFNTPIIQNYIETLPHTPHIYALKYPSGVRTFYRIHDGKITILDIVPEARWDNFTGSQN